MSFFKTKSILDVRFFVCALCTSHHVAIDKDKYGLHIVPATIATSKNSKQEYYMHCVKCAKDIGRA